MSTLLNRFKFYSVNDLSLPYYRERIKKVIDSYSEMSKSNDVNDIIELYNVKLFLDLDSSKSDLNVNNDCFIKDIKKVISTFFCLIDESSFFEILKRVDVLYLSYFWKLICIYKIYNKLSENSIINLLKVDESTLHFVLRQKELVFHFDRVLANYLRKYDNFGGILIELFLVDSSSELYIPKSLKNSEYEAILSKYLDTHDDEIINFHLILNSRNSKEFPISDTLRLKAKRKIELFSKKFEKEHSDSMFRYGVNICFTHNQELITYKNESNIFFIDYDIDWINNNLDYPTLLNNFIYIFGFVDEHCRFSNTTLGHLTSLVDSLFVVHGKDEYETNVSFNFETSRASAVLATYSKILESHNIFFDDIINWFFSGYLKNEFYVNNFYSGLFLKDRSIPEKCRNLASELDLIFKQFSCFVETKSIDSELIEISSKQVIFENIPSLIQNKYAYVISDDLTKEIKLLFSDQSYLNYVENFSNNCNSFYEIIKKHKRAINVKDFLDNLHELLYWLKERGAIFIDIDGTISLNHSRVNILYEFYMGDVLCLYRYKDNTIIEKLINDKEIECKSTLFSKPEHDYMNYVMNKSKFGNSLDLRNKYIHNTYPHYDELQQQTDYIVLLKIMILTILKINDEFCFVNS